MTSSAGELGRRLRAHLRDALDREVDFAIPPKPLGGGRFSAVSTFELADPPDRWSGRLVLRQVPGSGMQVRIEAGLQDGARAAGVPVPRVLLVEPRADVLGAPFMIMELLPGRGFLGGVEWYRFARDLPKMITSWPATFAAVLETLTRADATPVNDALARHGVPTHLASTTRHLPWIEQVLGGEPAGGDMVAWLRANQPDIPERASLVHGDLWPANVLMRRRVVCGLVDWTMGAVGDPALDVGFAKVGLALMPEPFPPPPPISSGVHAAGVRMATQIHERCASLVGGADRVAYYEALRCAVQLAVVHADRQLGRVNGWEHGVPALLRHFGQVSGIDLRLT